jgi:hypothetical protein
MADMSRSTGGGDPLRAMYFVAAVLMAVASLFVVLMMFIPRDIFSSSDPEAIWVPGTGEGYEAPERSGTAPEEALTPAQLEELHHH